MNAPENNNTFQFQNGTIRRQPPDEPPNESPHFNSKMVRLEVG